MPRKAETHRTAYQHILPKAHGKPIVPEQFLQNILKAYRIPANRQNPVRRLIH